MEATGLAAFVVALALVYLLPGADMILVLQTGIRDGRSSALAAAAGLAVARAVHVALAGAGLAALLRSSPALYDTLRLLGAAWIAWLGVEIARSPALLPAADAAGPPSRGTASLARAFAAGIATNLPNPKALLFCSVLLPQFVAADESAVAARFALLGTLLVAVGSAFDVAFALGGTAIGRGLAARPRLARLQARGFGALLLVFAAALVVERVA
jgi:threonine/homoserine/homoserine lactone efflux protein